MHNLRRNRWHVSAARDWSTLEWAGALCGEAGEAANVAKKLLRIDLGLRGNEASEHAETERAALRDKLANEIGDVIHYAALLASAEGIDLTECVRRTFNDKSDAMGFPERL
jgi:NTP pyrophosphatase (non-canonical NTP hydrolase)